MQSLESHRRIYTVSELSSEIREMLERRFTDIWVEGEISNFMASAAGHLYFTLKDDRAQLKAVCFRNTARLLRFRPENGKSFRARGHVSTYEGRGEYQLIVEVLEPAGLGALQLAFEQLKEKLEKEGLFRPERKRLLPQLPRKVGVVTSAKSAALRDFLAVLKRRHNTVDVLIYPAEVQGDSASLQIMEGIDFLSAKTDVDVIVITRGGGSMEDLWPFNEERVARAIIRSKKPVISAVGHEIDFTIADFVADLRAATPSAAAEIVIRSKEEMFQRVDQLQRRLEGTIKFRLSNLRHFLASKAGSRGFVVAETGIRRLSQRVDDLTLRLEQIGRTGAFLRRRTHQVESSEHRLTNSIQQVLRKSQQAFDLRLRLEQIGRTGALTIRRRHQVESVEQVMATSIQRVMGKSLQAFARIAHTLNALSPLAVLERGYAICQTPDGGVIRSAGQVAIDDKVTVRLHEGRLLVNIVGKEN